MSGVGQHNREDRNPSGKAERQRRYRRGHWAEWTAAALLMLKGYRICARRFSCSAGEIDLIAVRGRRIAFVEVKRRDTLASAHDAIGPQQRRRIENAADVWLGRNAAYRGYDIGLDVVFVTAARWPHHIENGL